MHCRDDENMDLVKSEQELIPRLQHAHLQIVNELYGSTIHLCYKKAGASLAVIQQVAEKTAAKTAKQVRRVTLRNR